MKEKFTGVITEIEVFYDESNSKYDFIKYDGFRIKTTNGNVEIGIENNLNCCESFGTMASNDNFSDFYGAEILEIKYTRENNKLLETFELKLSEQCIELQDILFITLETTKGTLQFAVYNVHNGYYGHDCYVSCDFIKEMNFEEEL